MSDTNYQFLNSINLPEDLRKLDVQDLRTVCAEVREFLIDCVSKTGGHLGAGLGTVELTVALHYVFQTPEDKLVWDVGHQAYPHKILTGRKGRMETIRKLGGLSGFLKRTESEFDTFGAGHASTAISAALGIAAARDLEKKDYKVVAIVGDGSMTGGMAYEGMNNAGVLKKNLIVVLNDNEMGSLSSWSRVCGHSTIISQRCSPIRRTQVQSKCLGSDRQAGYIRRSASDGCTTNGKRD